LSFSISALLTLKVNTSYSLRLIDVGNVFSSVQGLQFDWHINTEEPKDSSLTILKTVAFKDSSIDIDDQLLQLEQQGYQTSSILVQGVEVGKVMVTAKLLEAEYQVFRVIISGNAL
jgi:hypothetical protein